MIRTKAAARPWILAFALSWGAALCGHALAQEPATSGGLSAADEERLRMLSDPEALKKDAGSERLRPPFEFYRSQVAPSDVLPWVKAWHWHSMTVELRANLGDFDGVLQSAEVALPSTSYDLSFGREARLVKEQRSRLGIQFLLPQVPKGKELALELIRVGEIRPDQSYNASVLPLAPHQMLALVLTRESNGGYASWGRLAATIPGTLERSDLQLADSLRYYRLILPLELDKPLLPAHPLTWTAVSHVFWDGLEPDVLSATQQSAMLDWLHWGGQLVLMGGAGPKFSVLRDSFLEPYLPADPSGESRALTPEDLQALSAAYRPPPGFVAPPPEDPSEVPGGMPAVSFFAHHRPSYGDPAPIHPPIDRPIQAAGLRGRAGATAVALPGRPEAPIAFERRVGRGRVTMLAINPTDPALAAWEGIDTLVRRLVFRRPEESKAELGAAAGPAQPIQSIQGPDLSWYRIAARDVGAPGPPRKFVDRRMGWYSPGSDEDDEASEIDYALPGDGVPLPALRGVADWRDDAKIPRLCREALVDSSGIKVPSSSFVLKVVLAYLAAVAPLNWLVCRLVLRRREAAWVVAPLLAFAFAAGVERVAAYDLGFDAAGDELGVLELQADHPRGHLSRFVSLYSTGHGRFSIRFPDEPTALALPLNTGRSIVGEDRTTSTWRAFPFPALEGFTVQPRSLAMFRAEQMLDLPGPIAIEVGEGGARTIRNASGLELRDAMLVERVGPRDFRETFLGAIAPDALVELDDAAASERKTTWDQEGPDPTRLLDALLEEWEDRPEALGELRLVAWTPGPVPGPRIEPPLDRHRGATVVLAHLRYGEPPSPDGPRYDLNAAAESE